MYLQRFVSFDIYTQVSQFVIGVSRNTGNAKSNAKWLEMNGVYGKDAWVADFGSCSCFVNHWKKGENVAQKKAENRQ